MKIRTKYKRKYRDTKKMIRKSKKNDKLKNQVQHYTLIKNIVINNCISCFESVNTRNVAKRIRLCRGAT